MDFVLLQKLVKGGELTTPDDALHLVFMARADPEAGRTLWQNLLANNVADERLELVLHWIVESVIIDLIDNRIRDDDEYATVIGRRLSTLIEKLAEVPDRKHARAA